MSFGSEKILSALLSILLFLLPWQTIFFTEEKMLNGVKWEWGAIGFYGTEALLWLCVFLFIPWYLKRVELRIKSQELRVTKDRLFALSCLLFIVYCFLTSLWAPYQDVALQQAFRMFEAVLLFLMIFTGPLPWQKAAGWFVAGAVGQSFLGIWQFLSQSTFQSTLLGLSQHHAWIPGTSIVGAATERWLRSYGAFTHPNVLGGHLVVSLFLSFWLLYVENVNRIKNYELRIKNLILLISILLQATALFFTFSRSAWISAILMIIFLAIKFYRKYISYILSPIFVISILTLIFHPLVFNRVAMDTPHEAASVSERVSGYKEAGEIIRNNRWLGVGVGNYTAAVHAQYPERNGWEYVPVHNVPLLIVAELGIVGTLLLFGIVVSFFTYHLSLIKGRFGRWYVLCGTCIVVAPLVLFDHHLFSSYVGLLLCAVFVAVVGKMSVHNFSTVQDVDN